MKNRRKARELTLQTLYQADVRDIPPTEALRILLSRYRFKPEVEHFSKKLIQGTERFLPWIDELIKHYARNWTLDRMAIVDRNILRFSIYELLLMEEVPPIVSINEAVEIAKRYGTSDSGKFVNGILDKIRKERAPDSTLQWSYLTQKLHNPILTSFIKSKQKAKVYLVGGFIRNSLLGKESEDFDLILEDSDFELVEEFSRKYGKSPIFLNDNLRRVVLPGEYQLDFALKKSSSIESDLKKRDFTINALALDLDSLENPHLCLIDIKNGLEDLLAGRITLVSDEALDADPLRMLKAFRLKVQLNFQIDGELMDMILRKYQLINQIAQERLKEELFLILDSPCCGKHLTHSVTRKLLEKILNTPCYPENLHYLEKTLDFPPQALSSIKSELLQHLRKKIGGKTRLQLLKLVSLISSLPPARQVVEKVARALKLGNRETKLFQKMVNLFPLLEKLKGKLSDSPQVSEFFLQAGEETVEICLLAVAAKREEPAYLNFCAQILSAFFKRRSIILHPPRLVSGNELIQLLGIQPGPRVSVILKRIHQAQIAGEIQQKEEAIRLAREILNKG